MKAATHFMRQIEQYRRGGAGRQAEGTPGSGLAADRLADGNGQFRVDDVHDRDRRDRASAS